MILRLSSSTRVISELRLSIAQQYYPDFSLSELNPIERFWEFLKGKLQWEIAKLLHNCGKVG